MFVQNQSTMKSIKSLSPNTAQNQASWTKKVANNLISSNSRKLININSCHCYAFNSVEIMWASLFHLTYRSCSFSKRVCFVKYSLYIFMKYDSWCIHLQRILIIITKVKLTSPSSLFQKEDMMCFSKPSSEYSTQEPFLYKFITFWTGDEFPCEY